VYDPDRPLRAEPGLNWPPPHPSTRLDPPGPPPARRRPARAVVAAQLAVVAGVAVARRDTSSTSPSAGPAATAPAPAGTGTTAPPSPAAASTTALMVGVVDVNTRQGYQGGAAAGTGIVIASDEVLTNNHVVRGATSVTITDVSSGKSYKATVMGTAPSKDVALLKVQDATLQPAPLGDSSTVDVGEAVTAVGNAGGDGGAPAVTSGHVTALDQSIEASDGTRSGGSERLTGLIEMNARLEPGDSGGPLFDGNGKVIGINTAGTVLGRRLGGVTNYAIPVNTALDVAHLVERGKASDVVTIGTPGFLGIELADASAAGTTVEGVPVGDVIDGTPAQQIGVQAGDVITSVDGTKVTSSATLGQVLSRHHGGDKVEVAWTDSAGQVHTATATLVNGPAN
jgi:S1-C subfamily serine protease